MMIKRQHVELALNMANMETETRNRISSQKNIEHNHPDKYIILPFKNQFTKHNDLKITI